MFSNYNISDRTEEGYYNASNPRLEQSFASATNQDSQAESTFYKKTSCVCGHQESCISQPCSLPIHMCSSHYGIDMNSLYSGINGLEGKGILLERIKDAQDTIDQLSSKLCHYENEIIMLNQRKEAFEAGYYQLELENKRIKTDKSIKDKLLEKVNNMGHEVSGLLQTHQGLLDKHNEQERRFESINCQLQFSENECNSLKVSNDKLLEKSEENCHEFAKLKATEEALSKQLLILNIEKDALKSENHELMEDSLVHEEYRRDIENKLEAFEKQKLFSTTKTRENQENIFSLEKRIAFLQNEMKDLRKTNVASEKQLKKGQEELLKENNLLSNSKDLLKMEYFQMKEDHNSMESTIKELVMSNMILTRQSSELEENHIELLNMNKTLDSQLLEMSELCSKTECDRKILMQKLQDVELEKLNVEKKFKKEKQRCDNITKEAERSVTGLKKDVESLVSLKVKHKYLEEICASLQSENALLISTHHQEVSRMKNENKQLIKTCKSHEYLNKTFDNKVTKSNEMFNDLKEKYDIIRAANDEKTNEIESLGKHVLLLDGENEIFRNKNKENLELIELLNKQSKFEISSERANVVALESEVHDLKKALEIIKSENVKSVAEHDATLSAMSNKHKIQMDMLLKEKENVQSNYNRILEKLSNYTSIVDNKQKEMAEVNSANVDLKAELSLISKELESSENKLLNSVTIEQENRTLKYNIDEMDMKLKTLTKENQKLLVERKDMTTHTSDLLERFNSLMLSMDKQKVEMKTEKEQFFTREAELKKERTDLSNKYDNVKNELRKRTARNNSACNEVEVFKTDIINIKEELAVVTELNKKLEEVNSSLQSEAVNSKKVKKQLQSDIQTLKSSFENLLAKELGKQKSEFLYKENQLLKQLSSRSSAP